MVTYAFQADNGIIAAYLERVEMFLLANDIPDDKEVPTFLSLLGGKTNSLLQSLVSPNKPRDLSLMDKLTDALCHHFEHNKLVIAQRYIFHRRNQTEGVNYQFCCRTKVTSH